MPNTNLFGLNAIPLSVITSFMLLALFSITIVKIHTIIIIINAIVIYVKLAPNTPLKYDDAANKTKAVIITININLMLILLLTDNNSNSGFDDVINSYLYFEFIVFTLLKFKIYN